MDYYSRFLATSISARVTPDLDEPPALCAPAKSLHLELPALRSTNRTAELQTLLQSLIPSLMTFVAQAEEDKTKDASDYSNSIIRSSSSPKSALSSLVLSHNPTELQKLLDFSLPEHPQGQEGLLSLTSKLLQYSVNTWGQGYVGKLSSSTNAPGVAAELILAFLNTNVHVYEAAPALSIIERTTGQELAKLFGLDGPYAGGLTQQGGSGSNLTSIVVARNILFPETKMHGIQSPARKYLMLTSENGHYSLVKAGQILGFGSDSVWTVPVDHTGRMKPAELQRLIEKAISEGWTPFYVNATAGTTVLGAFDPFEEIADICDKFNIWFHIDASYGGSVAFSEKRRYKLKGSSRARSITVNPHKMLGAPVTCSFLLSPDLRQFSRSNTVTADYLFHNDTGEDELSWDLADMTLQCGRRGDALKLAMGWIWYGRKGYEEQIDRAFVTAEHLARCVQEHSNLVLISEFPPPCLQVCFYWAGNKILNTNAKNTAVTKFIARHLVSRGIMVDFAPGLFGHFLRPVVNLNTTRKTIEAIVAAIDEIGSKFS